MLIVKSVRHIVNSSSLIFIIRLLEWSTIRIRLKTVFCKGQRSIPKENVKDVQEFVELMAKLKKPSLVYKEFFARRGFRYIKEFRLEKIPKL